MKTMKEDVVVAWEILNGAADNQSINGAGVDMAGFEGVAFHVVAEEGEALAFSVKAQSATDSAFTDAADLAGTAVSFSTTAGVKGEAILDIMKPQERYVRIVLTVPDAVAAKAVSAVSMKYGADKSPVTQPGSAEFHLSPDEGTA